MAAKAVERGLKEEVERVTNKVSQKLESALPDPVKQKLALALQQVGPVMNKLGEFVDKAAPYVEEGIVKGKAFWERLRPYHPEELLPALFGFAMCFFGGHYFLTFAAIEAYRVFGWSQTIENLRIIYANYLVVLEASRKDDEIDDDGDGVADVKQISKKKLFTRKLALVLKACNPHEVSLALSGLWTGFIGVVATLRIQFAQTITMGASLADIFNEYLTKYLLPILHAVVPAEYHKWLPFAVSYIARTIGVSIAWFIARLLNAFYTSTRGAQLFAFGLFTFLHKRNWAHYDSSTGVFNATIVAMAAIGLYWQVVTIWSGLPFPLNLLFWPVRLLDNLLMYFVAIDTSNLTAAANATSAAAASAAAAA